MWELEPELTKEQWIVPTLFSFLFLTLFLIYRYGKKSTLFTELVAQTQPFVFYASALKIWQYREREMN